MKKVVAVLAFAGVLAGCSSVTIPGVKQIDGRYYVAGDVSCSSYQKASSSRIRCYSNTGKYVGDRDALSESDVRTMRQVSAARSVSAPVYVAPVYVPPPVIQPNVYQPMVLPQVPNYNTNPQVRCLTVRNMISCNRY